MLVNQQPLLYLGRDKVSGSYYFLSSKEGEGRFLKYVTYPFWCLASNIGNLLDLTAELPAEIMQDVISFVNGTVRYEIVPRKQGRAERVIRHQIESTPGEQRTGAASNDQGKSGPLVVQGQIGTPRGGNETSDGQPVVKRGRGRPRKVQPPDSSGVETAATGVAKTGSIPNGETQKRIWPFPPNPASPYASQEGASTGSGSSMVRGSENSSGNERKEPQVSEKETRRSRRDTSSVSQNGTLLAGSGKSDQFPAETPAERISGGRGSPARGDVLESSDQRGGHGGTDASVLTPVKRPRGRPRKNPPQ